jgi:hypothetical protein
MYGQCRCGAALTVDHLRNHCPLNKQRHAFDEASQARMREIVDAAWAKRDDLSHVAVLGEN